MSGQIGKNDQAARVKQLILGTTKHYPNASDTLQVGGASFTVSGLTQLMQSFVNAREAVEASKAATTATVQTERTQSTARLAVIRSFETVVRGTFGTQADVLADFGLAPPKARVPLTAEQKAVAAARRAATRAARNTMGKNQKKDIKGNVNAKLVVTPADDSKPVVVAAPAPATSGTGGSGSSTTTTSSAGSGSASAPHTS
jgi:hypothetical protein